MAKKKKFHKISNAFDWEHYESMEEKFSHLKKKGKHRRADQDIHKRQISRGDEHLSRR